MVREPQDVFAAASSLEPTGKLKHMVAQRIEEIDPEWPDYL